MFNMRNKKTRQIIAAIIAILLVLAMVLPLLISATAAENPALARTCQSGITVDGQDVSGKTYDEVCSLVNEQVKKKQNAVITLKGKTDDQIVTVSAQNLGLRWQNQNLAEEVSELGHAANIIKRYKESKDLEKNGSAYETEYQFDQQIIRTFLENNCLSWNHPAVNPTMYRENGAFRYTEGEAGYVVNEDASVQLIEQTLSGNWDGSDTTIALAIDEQQPSGTAADLQSMTSVLGSFTTYYSTSNAERKQNIATGCKLINGTTLQPGREFSVLKAITPFTAENGYALAGSYLGDEVVESFGGGICQVSTTLYNAVIRAELQVTARSNHSLIVGYVEPSDDAAIAESANMDFRFVNNLEHPVYIEGYADGGAISFSIYGVETRPAGRKISFVSETLTTTPSEGVKVKQDAAQPIGYVKSTPGHTGYTAQLWKVVTQDGVEVSRDVFNHSTYIMSPTYVTVGTAGTMTEELQAAIASADLNAIQTAAANAKNAQSAEPQEANVAEDAQSAAQEAYADALASGMDTNAAMEAAQAAANAIVNQSSSGSESGASTQESGTSEAVPESVAAADTAEQAAETAPAAEETAPAQEDTSAQDAAAAAAAADAAADAASSSEGTAAQ